MTENLKLLDQVRQVIRVKNYSYRTEQAYAAWINRYILYHDDRHPAEMGEPEVDTYLIRKPDQFVIAGMGAAGCALGMKDGIQHFEAVELPEPVVDTYGASDSWPLDF